MNSATLPYLTADIPGIGGTIKQYDEDFVVEEVPLYPASGEGTHLYLTIEKRGLPTLAAVKIIAKALGRQARDIGYAGLKDAHAVTRQRLSIEHIDPAQVVALSLSRIKVLAIERHTNKLKLGHLAGNRFEIKIRDAEAGAIETAGAVVEALVRRGCPNYFGPQRFGTRGDNAKIGAAVVGGDFAEAMALILGRPAPADGAAIRRARAAFDDGDLALAAKCWSSGGGMQARVCRALLRSAGDARRAWRAVDRSLQRLYVSAVQSELFNRVLGERIQGIDRLMIGDLAWKHANGACFRVVDAAKEQPRCDAFEISATGPLFGRRMTEPVGEPGQLEKGVLFASGLSPDRLGSRKGAGLDGARRPLRVPVGNLAVEDGRDDRGDYLRLRFDLPPGAYATSLVREVCKMDGL